MAFISAAAIIRSLAILNLTLAYYFLTSPNTISDHNLVFILGESMGLPQARSLRSPSASSSFLAATLALLGLTDLTAASLREEISSHYWNSQSPVRFLFYSILTAYSFITKPRGITPGGASPMGVGGLGENLSNGTVFTWAFLQTITWFWIFVALRDERREIMAKLARRKIIEEQNNSSTSEFALNRRVARTTRLDMPDLLNTSTLSTSTN